MPFTESLFRFADDKADLPELRRLAYKEGMLSLRMVTEVLRVTPDMQN
jgi:hypothetical protein